MLRPTIALAIAVFTLSACQTAPAQEPPAPPAPSIAPPAPAEDVDLFTLAIETGRWNVIIDRARDGVRQSASVDGDSDEALVLRSDMSLKSGALELLLLRNDACAKQLASARICTFLDWPAWTLELPTAAISPDTLQQRSDWLGEALGEMSAIGCDAGEAATGDERFCAVE